MSRTAACFASWLDVTPLTDAVCAVEFKIGANRVTAHDAMTLTTTLSPIECSMSGSSSVGVILGSANYVFRSFSGFLGICHVSFTGKFVSDSSFIYDVSLASFSRAIFGSHASLDSSNCCGPIILGTREFFSGNFFLLLF
jgi:hypothetical protein